LFDFTKGAWWLFITHNGRRRAKKVGDRASAMAVAKRLRESLACGDFHLEEEQTPAPVETVDGYADAWLRSIAGTLKASTVRFYTDNLSRHVRPLLGIRPIASVTRADCRELVATTIRRLSLEAPRPWTIRFDCVLFRVSVRLALRHETR
jgi:integrase